MSLHATICAVEMSTESGHFAQAGVFRSRDAMACVAHLVVTRCPCSLPWALQVEGVFKIIAKMVVDMHSRG